MPPGFDYRCNLRANDDIRLQRPAYPDVDTGSSFETLRHQHVQRVVRDQRYWDRHRRGQQLVYGAFPKPAASDVAICWILDPVQ